MSYAPVFQTVVDGNFAGNAQRFATQDEALRSAASRADRWTSVIAYAAKETTDKVNYRWDAVEGDVMLRQEKTP